MTKIGPIDAIKESMSSAAQKIFKMPGGQEGGAAFTAYITPEDFAKKGQVPAPGLTEGGSVFTS